MHEHFIILLMRGYNFRRHSFSNKELERGPNKILLTGEDLVFVSVKDRKNSKSKSVSLLWFITKSVIQLNLLSPLDTGYFQEKHLHVIYNRVHLLQESGRP